MQLSSDKRSTSTFLCHGQILFQCRFKALLDELCCFDYFYSDFRVKPFAVKFVNISYRNQNGLWQLIIEIVMFIRIFKSSSRFSSQIYDVIAIGPYASQVAEGVSNMVDGPIKILTVEEQNFVIEPSLVPYSSPVVKICQKNSEYADIEKGVGVAGIDLKKRRINLKNGSSHRYKYLVYSGNPQDWRDISHYKGLSDYSELTSSSIHSDYSFNGVQSMMSRSMGKVIVTVPQGRNFLSQNFFIISLQMALRQNSNKLSHQEDIGEVVIVNEGDKLCPLNQAHNSLLEKMLKKEKIQHLKNKKLQFDYRNKKVHLLNDGISLNFNSLFQYLPLKVPNVLQLDPFHNNQHTLNHSIYENVYILANVFPTNYSLTSLHKMIHIMSRNIAHKIIGVRSQTIYQGESRCSIWRTPNECIDVKTSYHGTKASIHALNPIQSMVNGFYQRNFGKWEVERVLNGRVSPKKSPHEEEFRECRTTLPVRLENN